MWHQVCSCPEGEAGATCNNTPALEIEDAISWALRKAKVSSRKFVGHSYARL